MVGWDLKFPLAEPVCVGLYHGALSLRLNPKHFWVLFTTCYANLLFGSSSLIFEYWKSSQSLSSRYTYLLRWLSLGQRGRNRAGDFCSRTKCHQTNQWQRATQPLDKRRKCPLSCVPGPSNDHVQVFNIWKLLSWWAHVHFFSPLSQQEVFSKLTISHLIREG